MKAIVDSGVLVALLVAKDKHHEWAKEVVGNYPAPLLTCESVLSETQFIVSRMSSKRFDVAELVTRGFLTVEPVFDRGADKISTLLRRYANFPASLADASLIYLSEQHSKRDVLSTDSDFKVYRRSDRTHVPCILPR